MGNINVSIGIAGWPLEQLSLDDVMKLADQALYLAKRNRSQSLCCRYDL
ncbi:diguanylate cyclase domain-containing protein [Pseudoalteromonas sp. JSTW]|nr:diguanylate cyclase [Pseudoalteromonas sp. JSTW]